MAERITDVYKQIKKARRCHKEVKTSSRVSEDNRNVALPKNNPSDLQILKEFDLALEFGPCAACGMIMIYNRFGSILEKLWIKDVTATLTLQLQDLNIKMYV
ncbi:uncharacterized protein LOC112561069 isoform X2 [Pomacea canaliculata]|uniref:uncharacterized protein LOC112561069 isoform X2 n=1 Tax=Pomacea canaliculata TaxID=400727 RepID=UPI000D727036|nr:uncharacterized protein LOC112561069 isoform X2 [Pomacea canaliculata]